MDLKVTTLDGEEAGSVTLNKDIFGLEPRTDLIQRYVIWQLAKRQAGTHKTKDRSEINRTGKKMYAQKGTGQARHGSARVNLFRGGGRSFGPVVRSHEHGLPKKVRALALKHALSSKAKDGGLILVEGAVPGVKGGWITMRDAVKKALPKDAPKPGKFKAPAAAEKPAAEAPATEAAPAKEGA